MFHDATFAAFRTAVLKGQSDPPEMNSVWFDPQRDDYFTRNELATIGLELFKQGKAGPYILGYSLTFGDENQKSAAIAEFNRSYRAGDGESYAEWSELLPYLLRENSKSMGAPPRIRDKNLNSEEELPVFILNLLSGNPVAFELLNSFISREMNGAADEPFNMFSVCKVLSQVLSMVPNSIPESKLKLISKATVKSWEEIRINSNETPPLVGTSWQLLEWCWRFNWHETLDELFNNSIFMNDCFGQMLQPAESKFPYVYPFASEFGKNLLAISLISSKEKFPPLPSSQEIIQRHLDLAITKTSKDFPRYSSRQFDLLGEKVFGDSYPTEIPRMEEKAKYWQPGVLDFDYELLATLFPICQAMWRLRLALAIFSKR